MAPKDQVQPTTALAGTGTQTRRLVLQQELPIRRGLGVDDRIRTGDRLDHKSEAETALSARRVHGLQGFPDRANIP
jgi:hypothetical protein